MAFRADLLPGNQGEAALLAMGGAADDLHIMLPKLCFFTALNGLARFRADRKDHITAAGYSVIFFPPFEKRGKETESGIHHIYGNTAVFSAFLAHRVLPEVQILRNGGNSK